MFYVYAIRNIIRDKIYIGQTSNLESRLNRHNGLLPNKLKSYTRKNSGIWILVYKEEFETRQEAIRREKELKSYQGRNFVKKIIENQD